MKTGSQGWTEKNVLLGEEVICRKDQYSLTNQFSEGTILTVPRKQANQPKNRER